MQELIREEMEGPVIESNKPAVIKNAGLLALHVKSSSMVEENGLMLATMFTRLMEMIIRVLPSKYESGKFPDWVA